MIQDYIDQQFLQSHEALVRIFLSFLVIAQSLGQINLSVGSLADLLDFPVLVVVHTIVRLHTIFDPNP